MLSLFILFVAVGLTHSHGHSKGHDKTPPTHATLDDVDPSKPEVQQQILDIHNKLRRDVRPVPGNMLKMEWNEEAAKKAAQWSEGCVFKHSEAKKRTTSKWLCGENLFQAGYVAEWPEAIQEWYDEEQNYTYGIGPAHENAMIGHFTQLVWARSFQIGCAIKKCDSFYLYVCHYCPAGNEDDEIHAPYTSATPCEHCPDHCDDGLCTNPCPWVDNYGNCPELKTKNMCGFKKIKGNCDCSCNCVHGLNPNKEIAP